MLKTLHSRIIIGSAVVITAVLFSLSFYNHAGIIPYSLFSPVLRMGVLDAPIFYEKTDVGLDGMDYELGQKFAHYIDQRLTIKSYHTIEELFSALKNGEIDIAAGGLFFNQKRADHYLAGPAYYSASLQVVYNNKNKRPTLSNLKGAMAVTSSYAINEILSNLKQKHPNLTWQIENQLSQEDLLKKVANGQLDYTVGTSVLIGTLQAIYPQLKVAFDITDEEPIMWYVNQDNTELHHKMTQFFTFYAQNGFIAKLEEKYLPHIRYFDYVDTKTFIKAIETILPNYQHLFEKYADHIPWQTLAAIAYQESHWDPIATSPTGVRGIMMLTHSTAKAVGVTDRTDPEQSIKGGALYLNSIIETLPAGIKPTDKIWFALAAYNMGLGHLLDARNLTRHQGANPNNWDDVKKRLPMLNKTHYYAQTRYGYAQGAQAYKYTNNIERYLTILNTYLKEKKTIDKIELDNTIPFKNANLFNN